MGTLVKQWPAAIQLLIVGFYVAFSLIIPTVIGLWFDKRAAHEFPYLTLIGLGVGTIVMIYGVYRMVKPFLEGAKKEQLRGPAKMLSKLASSKPKKDKEQE